MFCRRGLRFERAGWRWLNWFTRLRSPLAEVKLLPRRLRRSGLAALRSAIVLPPEENRLCPRGLGRWAEVRAQAKRPRRYPAALRVLKEKELVLSARAGADG